LQLPDDLRDQLKTPLGNLISDNDPNKENIIKILSSVAQFMVALFLVAVIMYSIF